jgi:4-amino-4-deoxy-L-arabinose transferase-like glycosyltransferase
LLAAAFIPLTEDEAYYRLWAEHLSAGYFDHPPMVAWWIAAGRSLVGDTALGARLVSVFATTLASFVIIDIGRTLGFSDQASERAGLWYNATILVALGGAVITPDAPATFFWTLTLWAVARAWRSKAGAWWIGAGAAAGLACLSKYSALFIGPGILLWLLCSQDGRRKLRRPWPWLALVVAVAAFSPNLIWNAGHHWLALEKQFSRVTPSAFTPRHVLDVPATQFLLLNPLIASFAVLAILDLARGRNIRATSLLVVTGAPFAGYLCLHSLHAGVQAHWPAPLYPGAALLAASAAETRIAARWRTVAAAVPWFGFGVASVVLVHMALPQTDWLGRRDPVMPLRGWAAFAQSVETQRVRVGGGWVGTFSYGEAAELLDQRKSDAPILELIERERFLVLGQAPRLNGPGVVVDLRRRIAADDLQLCFGEVRRLADLERGDRGRPGIAYAVFYAAGPKLDLVNRGCRLGKDKPAASEP